MAFLRRARMSDETIEQILSARPSARPHASTLEAFGAAMREAGTQPPSEPAAAAHLAAIAAESRRVREGAVHAERPALPGRLHAGSKRLAASVAASTAFLALAVAGALPGPVQAAASDALAVVGISIPGGDDERSDADREQAPRPAPNSAGLSRSAGQATEPGGRQPRPVPATSAAGSQAGGDRDRSADRAGDGARRDERGSDDDRRDSDEASRDRDDQRGGEDDDARDESGADLHSGEDRDEVPGGGIADDEEGPDTGSRPTDERDEPDAPDAPDERDEPDDHDEPDEPDTDAEERSGPSADALPDAGDVLDEPEE